MFREVKLGGPAKGPLSGVRVADFSAVFSGPICASILADQGADVIKIESFEGDLMRRGLPQQDGMGSAFVTMNRNKRSLAWIYLAQPVRPLPRNSYCPVMS